MPTIHEIREEILKKKGTAQDEIRRNFLKDLADYTKRDTIVYASAFTSNKGQGIPGNLMSVVLEDIQGFMSAMHNLKSNNLDLILHSPGGSIEAADQIVQYLRAKYTNIRAIVPQNAMSAASMISCACDEIVMGRHSAIGPIDPQVSFPTQSGGFTAPAQAILDEFERAKEEVANDPNTAPLWAEKIRAYPHGFLTLCKTALDHSRLKVEEWLKTYMFKNDKDRERLSIDIANWLASANEHKSHGRPISAEKAKEIGLKIKMLEDDQDFQEKVLSVFHASMVTFGVTPCVKFVENHEGRGSYLNVDIQPSS